MDTPDFYISIFVISGCTFSLFFSIALFIRRKADRRNLIGSIIFLLQSIWIYCNYYRIFRNTDISNIFIVGTIVFLLYIPVLYIFFRSLFDINYWPDKKYAFLFAISFFLIIPAALTIEYPGNGYILDGEVRRLIIIAVVSAGHLYFIIILCHVIFTAVKRLASDNAWTAAYIMLLIFILMLNMVFCFFFIDLIFGLGLLRFSFLAGTLLIYYFFIIFFNFPVFTTATFRSGSNQSDTLRGIDLEGSIRRIMELMEVDRVYRDESLTQRRLADMAELSPQQLSAILAIHLNTAYYAFINSFRVAEAKELLRSNREIKVVDVAYTVGFKSLSVFYKAFNDETGMSPKTFQQNLH